MSDKLKKKGSEKRRRFDVTETIVKILKRMDPGKGKTQRARGGFFP